MKRNRKFFAFLLAGALTLGAIPLTSFNASTAIEGEDLSPSECSSVPIIGYNNKIYTDLDLLEKDEKELVEAFEKGYVSVPDDPSKPIEALTEEEVYQLGNISPMIQEPSAHEPTSALIDVRPYKGNANGYFGYLSFRATTGDTTKKVHYTTYKTLSGKTDTNSTIFCLQMHKKNPPDGSTMTYISKMSQDFLALIRIGVRGSRSYMPSEIRDCFYTSSAGSLWQFYNYYIVQTAIWRLAGDTSVANLKNATVTNGAPDNIKTKVLNFIARAPKYAAEWSTPKIWVNHQRKEATVDEKDPSQYCTPKEEAGVGAMDSPRNCLKLMEKNVYTDAALDMEKPPAFTMTFPNGKPRGLRVLVLDKRTGKNRVYHCDNGDVPKVYAQDQYRFIIPNPTSSGEFDYKISGPYWTWRAYRYKCGSYQEMMAEDIVEFGEHLTTQGTVYWTKETTPEPPPPPPTEEKDYYIRAKKVDAKTGQALPGAEFELTKPNGVKVTKVTNSNGIAQFPPIPENQLGNGRFTVTETKAPEGYTLPPNATQIVTLPPQSGTTVTVTFRDEPIAPSSFPIKVVKKDSADKRPLQGAKFTLTKPDGTKLNGTSNVNGEVIFSNLTATGKYIIEEVTPPPGYSLSTTPRKEVNVTDTKNPPTAAFEFLNEKIKEEKGKVELTKTDSKTGSVLRGVQFKLYKKDGTLVGTYTTNSSGVITVNDLAYGDYYFIESRPLDGYLPNTDKLEFTVGANATFAKVTRKNTPKEKLYEVTATKVDKADKKPLRGATFELTGPNGVKQTAVSGTDGVVRFSGLKAGEYTLTETKAPAGYQLAQNPSQKVTVPGQTTALIFENEKIKEPLYEINATKVDKADKKPLAGATFELTGPNGYKQTAISGENGTVKFDQLKAGDYTLTETKAPEGYQLAQNPSQKVSVPGNTKGLIFENEKIPEKGKVELLKHDSVTNKHLQGVEFALYKKGAEGSDVLVGNFVTDENGKILVENLEPGEYYFVETKGLEGYRFDNSKLNFTIPAEGGLIQLTKGNVPDTSSVEITKTDVSTGEVLAGATIKIYAEDKTTVLAEGVTDSTGKFGFGPLKPGKYYFQESGAPDGYVLDETLFPFEIKPGGEIVKCTMTNKPIEGKVEITKTDVSTGEVLAGAHIKIYAEDKETVLAGGVTDSNGKFTFGPLKPGKYYFQESGAPEGYVLDDTLFPFEVKEHGEIVKCQMTNKPIKGTLEITKVDISDGKLLPNAHFIIYDENKNQVVKGVTDENGIAKFQLGYGKYYYQEYDAPVGYQLDDTLFPFEIKTDGEIVKCRMTNVPKPKPALPTTGAAVATSGSLIAAVGAVASALFRRWL